MNYITNCVFLCAREFRQNNALALHNCACPVHSPFGFVHLTHQNLSACALYCLNSLAKVNTQLLIYNQRILTCPLQNSLISSAVACCPDLSLIHAQISSPILSSGMPITLDLNKKCLSLVYMNTVFLLTLC